MPALCAPWQDDSGAVVVTNLTAIPVKSPEEIFDILGRSFRRRATSETLMNQFSSRSHSIFTVNVRGCLWQPVRRVAEKLSMCTFPLTMCYHRLLQVSATVVNPAGSRVTKTSRLNFVDLSGSENMKRRCGRCTCRMLVMRGDISRRGNRERAWKAA